MAIVEIDIADTFSTNIREWIRAFYAGEINQQAMLDGIATEMANACAAQSAQQLLYAP